MTGLRRPPDERLRTALTVVDAQTGARTDLVVTADPSATADALEEAVATRLRAPVRRLWLGGSPLAPPHLRAGAVLGLGGPVDSSHGPRGLRLEVMSGTGAGTSHPLTDELRVGRAVVTAGRAGVTAAVAGGPATVVRPGRQLDLGDRVVMLAEGPLPPAAAEVSRPPRLRPALSERVLEVPRVPAPPEGRRLPVVPLLLPLALGVVMALLSSPLFLLFTLLSPVMAVSTWWSDRLHSRRTRDRLEREHAAAVADLDAEVGRLREEESWRRHADAPGPAEVASPGPRLWERRRADDDVLALRLGSGSAVPRSYRLREGAAEPLAGVPVSVPLREVGVLGLVDAPATARWLVAQAAALHSPRDLSIWLLCDPLRDSEPGWSWVRWLPHLRPTGGADCLATAGTTPETVAARAAELAALVAARRPGGPHVLVVLDGGQALRSVPGVAAVLRDGPAVGVHVICLEDAVLALPEECRAVVAHGVLQVSGCADVAVQLDGVTPSWAEERARAMAPLRDPADADQELPSATRLLDLLQLDPPSPDRVRARAGRTTAAVLGVGADGPVAVDLRRDGPHVLVAGTTGAGKSELLQTLVASLAVANRPDALAFVLIDYKGGAAFRECARLPHTVGMVTDLDGHLVERALSSLRAELRGREAALEQAGAKDIEALWQTGGRLPRLVIVVDELAALVEELPELVRGLVGIAQRGRSLGVHLVLATQRPSGVVTPEIRANTDLRIALRVTDAADSLDVLDSAEAATIPRATPGRGFARTGPGPLQAFQSARVGGRRRTARGVEVLEVPWAAVGEPLLRSAEERDDEPTDLHLLVEAVRAAHPGASVRSPWLPPLPAVVTATPAAPLTAVLGLSDLPDEQRQAPAVLDLERGGHLLVAGAARSGRSTLLRTLAASLAGGSTADDVQLYALDCGNGALSCLTVLPHTGAVVTRDEPDRVDRLLARLMAEVAHRQQLLAEAGWASLAEQRAASDVPLPYLVLLLDRWDGFLAAFGEVDAGRLPDTVLRLLREGAAVGLRVVVTGDRTVLLGTLAHAVEDTVVLRLAERSDYALVGLSPRSLPDAIGDGRGFRGGTALQVALLTEDPSGAAQTAALRTLAATLSPGVAAPFRVDPLPTRLSWQQAQALPGSGFVVGGDALARIGADLGTGFTVAGPPRSGRSTALLAIARWQRAEGVAVCVLAPRPSPLRDLPGLAHLDTSPDPDPAALAAALSTAGRALVLVDDAELLATVGVADLLSQVLRDGRDHGHALALAGTVEELGGCFRGVVAEARRSRSGLLLGLTSHLDGELLGVRLPRSAVSTGPVGRGLLVRSGEVSAVQVPA